MLSKASMTTMWPQVIFKRAIVR